MATATSSNPFLNADGEASTCIEMLHLIVDNQATEEQQAYFQQHIDYCLPCYKKYNVDIALRDLLVAKCSGSCPEDIVTQIKSKINSMKA